MCNQDLLLKNDSDISWFKISISFKISTASLPSRHLEFSVLVGEQQILPEFFIQPHLVI